MFLVYIVVSIGCGWAILLYRVKQNSLLYPNRLIIDNVFVFCYVCVCVCVYMLL